jgi:signal transduction histidine kinase
LSRQQLNALDTLARQVVRNMELRSACLREHDRAALLDRLNSRKNRLFKLVSHDLKSPFSGVLGMLEYLIEHQASMSPAEIREDLLALLASSGETFKLLERLLQWSTFDSGEMPYRPKRLDVNELLEGVVILLRGVARRKGIELRVLPGAELAVLADLTMTHSVVQNLVGNALKFTPSGGTVTVAATRQDDWVEISVRDSGVGLSSERIRQIMNRESAGLPANSTLGTAGEAGTGLGIDLCRGFVDKHGGHFAVDSTPGEGACFRFTLPRAD